MFAIGVLISPIFFRVTRAVALGLRRQQYVEAAELMGASRVVDAAQRTSGARCCRTSR